MQLKVLCLNLWNGGELLEQALDFITGEDPDILFLQEVYDGKDASLEPKFRSLSVLRARLNYPNHDYAPEFIDNRTKARIPQGNAIFSKLPIIYRDVTFFDRPLDEHYVEMPENYLTISRNLQHVTIQSSAGAINCFNFHGVYDLDGDNYSDSRKNMSEVIIEAVSCKPNVILAGDTNAKPTNLAMKNVEIVLKSVFGDSLVTTFNMKRKNNPGYATAAVDMLFISDNFTVIDSGSPAVDVSDHLPLTATLELQEGIQASSTKTLT